MRLSKRQKDMLVGVVVFFNPITIFWFWGFYSNFYFYQSLLFAFFAFLITRAIFSYHVEYRSIPQAVFLGLMNGLVLAVLQRFQSAFLSDGDKILLMETSIFSFLMDSVYMSMVMPFLSVCVVNIMFVRWVRKKE
jgi:hypothetical protein